MGQKANLLRRAQGVSYTEATSDRSHRSQVSPRPGGPRCNYLPDAFRQENDNDHGNREAHRHDRGRDAGHRRRAYEPGHDQEVDQGTDYNLRRSLPHRDVHDHINKHINDRAAHENIHRIEYDTVHGLLG